MKAKMKLLQIDEAAKILKISHSTIRRLIDSGILPAITITAGRRKRLQRIDEADLEKFIQSLKKPTVGYLPKSATLRVAKGV